MTRQRKLKEVLNVRLDVPLAAEIRRIAMAEGRSESDVARTLLGYGVDVSRQLEAQRLSRPYEEEYPDPESRGFVSIQAEWIEGYRPGEVGSVIDDAPTLEDERQ
jgi:hypothetical protein